MNFTWLHLSDLHVGIDDQNWLWPNLKQRFFEDVKKLYKQVGPWELVIFSGDCTQKGAVKEYNQFTEVIKEIWSVFDQLGFKPLLVVVPGNHDLVRPSDEDAKFLVMNDWWSHPKVRGGFFNGGSYLNFVNGLFTNYRKWLETEFIADLRPDFTSGLLAGDFSTRLKIGTQTVGIVGLNSTWLQIGQGDCKGRLHVDARQLLAVTGNDPDNWCSENIFNILVTHQPSNWLQQTSLADWEANIFLPSRFDIHLYGHMHEPTSTSIGIGGSQARISLQAPSMFGLPEISSSGGERIHGFYLGQFSSGDKGKQINIWPRKLRKLLSGQYKMGIDPGFDTNDDGAISCFLGATDIKSVATDTDVPSPELGILQTGSDVIDKYRYRVFAPLQHQNVRRVEQRKAVQVLRDERALWLIAEWGLASDEFIASVHKQMAETIISTYSIDLGGQNLSGVGEFLDGSISGGLANFWVSLARKQEACLIFDEIAIGQHDTEKRNSPEHQLEEIVSIALEFCPNLHIIMRARRLPADVRFSTIELRSLDLGDTRSYIEHHRIGGLELCDVNTIDSLYRHTDGVPVRIDTSLKDLAIVSLPELLSTNSDFNAVSRPDAPSEALKSAIDELASSTDPGLRRSFLLLKALSSLPQGDKLSRIKRLASNSFPFFAPHAGELIDRALIESITSEGLRSKLVDGSARTLKVPRLVRECIHDRMKPSELSTLNKKAADVYFGQGWSSGAFKQVPQYRFDNPHCSSSDIVNASTIVLRLYRDAVEQKNQRGCTAALSLANGYTDALEDGHHYRSIVAFCADFTPMIKESEDTDKVAHLKLRYAKALRMNGEDEEAKEILLALQDHAFGSQTKQSVLLNLALVHEQLREPDLACNFAKQILAKDKNSNAALQAKAILLQNDEKDGNRGAKLAKLETLARQRKAHVVANNVALFIANNGLSQTHKAEDLGRVMQNATNYKDYYNRMRAIISVCELKAKTHESLSDEDIVNLSIAYHFLFNGNFPNLFSRCHDLLWRHFERQNDNSNLLVLFRQSSLVWRLRGEADKEEICLRRLAKAVGDSIIGDIRRIGREAAYYLVRASSFLIIKLG